MARNDILEPPIRPDGLQIDDHRPAQERFWRVERVAHVAFGGLVVVAALGLFGANGPFAGGAVETAAGRVDYVRIARWQTPAEFDVTFAAAGPTHTLTLTSPAWPSLTLSAIHPQPAAATALPDGIRLTFAGEGQGSAAALEFTPTSPGIKPLTVAVDDAAPQRATMLVLP